jgi:phage shock protein C
MQGTGFSTYLYIVKQRQFNLNNINNYNMKKKLERSTTHKMVGGVAAGLAEYFDIDVTLIRVLFLVAIFAPIPAIIPYIAFWIAMPVKQEYTEIRVN